MNVPHASQVRIALLAAACIALLGACSSGPSKAEQEAAKNTFACTLAGERVVVRFEPGEARLLMPGGDRVNLYQVPSASGMRYTNGSIDLLGKGLDLQLARDGGTPVALVGCEPFIPPPIVH